MENAVIDLIQELGYSFTSRLVPISLNLKASWSQVLFWWSFLNQKIFNLKYKPKPKQKLQKINFFGAQNSQLNSKKNLIFVEIHDCSVFEFSLKLLGLKNVKFKFKKKKFSKRSMGKKAKKNFQLEKRIIKYISDPKKIFFFLNCLKK